MKLGWFSWDVVRRAFSLGRTKQNSVTFAFSFWFGVLPNFLLPPLPSFPFLFESSGNLTHPRYYFTLFYFLPPFRSFNCTVPQSGRGGSQSPGTGRRGKEVSVHWERGSRGGEESERARKGGWVSVDCRVGQNSETIQMEYLPCLHEQDIQTATHMRAAKQDRGMAAGSMYASYRKGMEGEGRGGQVSSSFSTSFFLQLSLSPTVQTFFFFPFQHFYGYQAQRFRFKDRFCLLFSTLILVHSIPLG